MKILQVHAYKRQPGGEDTVVREEAELLTRAAHKVVPYMAQNPTSAVATAASLAVSPWNPGAALALRSLVRRVRPDVAHVHNTWFALSPSVVAALDGAGVPVVMTLHNYRLLCATSTLFRDGRVCEDCVGTHPWRGVVHRCYRGSTVASLAAAGAISLNRALKTWQRHVRLFLALNDFARQQFIRGGLPGAKIRVKPNFVPDPGSRKQPPSASRTVLYVGRLTPEKGVKVLLEAWQMVHADSLELVVLGDGPMRGELERAAPANVRFEGRVPLSEVRRLMLRSRALIVPSIWYEGQPMVVLEAAASGLPVLASKLGGNIALLEPVGGRWLAAPGDLAAWTRSLEGIQDQYEVDRAGAGVRRLYEERYNERIALRLLEDAYLTARDGVA